MASNQGTIERIEKNRITISGIVKQYNKPVRFQVGDRVEYRVNKNPSKNRFDIITVIRPSTEINMLKSVITLEGRNDEAGPVGGDTEEVTYDEYKKHRVFKAGANAVIKKIIVSDEGRSRFDFSDLTTAQFCSFQERLARHNYSFEGKKIKEYIEARIEREVGGSFYRSFNDNFIDRLDEFYGMSELSQIKEDKNFLNRELFLLLKKYYRYEGAKKIIGGRK